MPFMPNGVCRKDQMDYPRHHCSVRSLLLLSVRGRQCNIASYAFQLGTVLWLHILWMTFQYVPVTAPVCCTKDSYFESGGLWSEFPSDMGRNLKLVSGRSLDFSDGPVKYEFAYNRIVNCNHDHWSKSWLSFCRTIGRLLIRFASLTNGLGRVFEATFLPGRAKDSRERNGLYHLLDVVK